MHGVLGIYSSTSEEEDAGMNHADLGAVAERNGDDDDDGYGR